MKTSGPFYLSVIDNPVSSIWFKKTPMGKNTINKHYHEEDERKLTSEGCSEKKITSHSARKTAVKKLKSFGVPKCEIKNIKARANGFNICFNISSILLNAVERLLNDVERRDDKRFQHLIQQNFASGLVDSSRLQTYARKRAKLKLMTGRHFEITRWIAYIFLTMSVRY